MFGKPKGVPSKADALPGRTERMAVPETHFVNGHRLSPPFPENLARAVFVFRMRAGDQAFRPKDFLHEGSSLKQSIVKQQTSKGRHQESEK